MSDIYPPVRTTVAATVCSIVSYLPGFLVGAAGVLIRSDLVFDQAVLGAVVATFFVSSALTSVLGGRIAERLGVSRAMMIATAGSAAALGAIAGLAQTPVHIATFLAVAGACSGIGQPAANLAIARAVRNRQGLIFGVKQGATPVTTLLAGAAVPVVGLTVGWRWMFVAASVLAVAALATVPHRREPLVRDVGHRRSQDAGGAPLVALALAVGLAAAATVSFGTFLVESAVEVGMSAGEAGWLLASGSVAGIVARLIVGWLSDRWSSGHLAVVAGMVAGGAIGLGALAVTDSYALIIAATFLAFALGWGWPGLLQFSIVRLNPNAPAAASGIVYMGTAAGAAAGPFFFGLLAAHVSFESAWWTVCVLSLVSAALLVGVRRWLIADRTRRAAR